MSTERGVEPELACSRGLESRREEAREALRKSRCVTCDNSKHPRLNARYGARIASTVGAATVADQTGTPTTPPRREPRVAWWAPVPQWRYRHESFPSACCRVNSDTRVLASSGGHHRDRVARSSRPPPSSSVSCSWRGGATARLWDDFTEVVRMLSVGPIDRQRYEVMRRAIGVPEQTVCRGEPRSPAGRRVGNPQVS